MSLLSVRELRVSYPTPGGVVQAVRGVSLDIAAGETVGLVGESGCGKSTLGKAIMRLTPTASGQVWLDGHDVTRLPTRRMRPLRSLMQMVFQDPHGSLNPRHRVGKIIGQPMSVAGRPRREIDARVQQLLAKVGLPPGAAARFPHEFSGGQRQRIGIARALALQPKLLICDEPVSALDVSVRAQIINLLQDLQGELGVSYLFISHDLAVVRHVCDRLLVMYLGQVVESGPTEAIWERPSHPYTRLLLAASPVADPRLRQARPEALLRGELPNPLAPPSGCAFRTRCAHATARCASETPGLRELSDGRHLACHFDLPPLAAPPVPANVIPFQPTPSVHATAYKFG
ncbi:ABC transporter ATP-binding protein [Variovorax saccharolyticus]|uniref:ABC transporter ATP-binding protein n=1 Tax=Variovorax saccharolyticus TaxID=3053516 RepID=UPI002575C967|nr:oligopeptide/dipeptide ABC transporter ATP-binding protein [Variovorax sp. J22R187]MDM0021450.1 ATP-binding cassette domain-containing protein [Variovorax sp. J22R187]